MQEPETAMSAPVLEATGGVVVWMMPFWSGVFTGMAVALVSLLILARVLLFRGAGGRRIHLPMHRRHDPRRPPSPALSSPRVGSLLVPASAEAAPPLRQKYFELLRQFPPAPARPATPPTLSVRPDRHLPLIALFE